MRNKLPYYRPDASTAREEDFRRISEAVSIEDLSKSLYQKDSLEALEHPSIHSLVGSELFAKGADIKNSDEYANSLGKVIKEIGDASIELGYPKMPRVDASKIDAKLASVLKDSLTSNRFSIDPVSFTNIQTQRFFLQRIIPLVTFWRWSVVTRKPFSKDRILSSRRNYFYTLSLAGHLFEDSENENDRWKVLDSLSADSFVQIVERPGIGLRREFSIAIAKERYSWEKMSSSSAIANKLTRGAMLRATFTFATAVMLDNAEYYKRIARHLFDWSADYYLDEQDRERIYQNKHKSSSQFA